MSFMTDNNSIRPNFAEYQVIIAEDEPMATKLAQGALKLMGFRRIFHAPDGLKALKLLKELDGDVQLIVSDWNMPNMRFVMLTGMRTRISSSLPANTASTPISPSPSRRIS